MVKRICFRIIIIYLFKDFLYYIYIFYMSKITYEQLLKEKNKYDRFDSNINLNKRESYDDSNKIINSLNEEILSLKRKMKFVFEKDKEIEKYKLKINELDNIIQNSDNKYKTENTALKINIVSLEDKNTEYLNKIDELLSIENKEKYEHNDIVKENSLLKRELNLLKKQKNNDETKIIDREKLKKAISIKLQAKQDKQVDNLLNRLL